MTQKEALKWVVHLEKIKNITGTFCKSSQEELNSSGEKMSET